MIDAHAHLDKYRPDEIDEVLAVIDQRRILTMSVSVDAASFALAEAIAARSSLVVPAFGIHPENAPVFVDSLAHLEAFVDRAPMIGEVGLDHRFVTDKALYGAQQQIFSSLLGMARTKGKLVNVHSAGAEQAVADQLRSERIERAIIHWYSGPLDVLTQLTAEGFMFTVGVEVLHSEHIRQIARVIPADQLLTETDNPGGQRWLTGNSGNPSLLDEVMQELARLRGIHPDDLAAIVHGNLVRLLEGDSHLALWLAELRQQPPG